MSTMSRRFGAYDVTMLRDGVVQASTDHLVHRRGEDALAQARARIGSFPLVVNCFLLTGDNGVTLVDAGCGTAWGADFGKARLALADLGIAPQDVDRVLVTHLHGDHVPGLWEDETPYFPRAKILVPEVELSFFTDEAARQSVPEARRSGFGLAAQLIKAYGARVQSIPHGPVLDGIEAVALPGHTPGHTGYRIGAGKDGLLIFADALHLAAYQPQDLDLCLVYDLDADAAARTRLALLAAAAEDGFAVTGCHIDGYGRVEREGHAFRLDLF
ncbi:MBL fold metallo-hydrolase [Rhizobium sp. SGZ-381]|uniref:AidB family quorum-quenching N-acyl homoserine lactonase n=1 Tax=Rhizobium sp. SGZ-381 TaxID=3342800 RepID=UPI00366BB10A